MFAEMTHVHYEIKTVDMHTGGEPLRIFECPVTLQSLTILDRRNEVAQKHDWIRKFLMLEPRGHQGMYGAMILPPRPEVDLSVLFLHNEGYSTFCGHAIIALTRYIVDKKQKTDVLKRTVKIECPAGVVDARLEENNFATFESPHSFLLHKDFSLKTPTLGTLSVDIAYGGTFYVLINQQQLGLNILVDSTKKVVEKAREITECAKQEVPLKHPLGPDVAFIYGTIVTDGKELFDTFQETNNICIFADSQVDRCPTGSGVAARIATMFSKRQIDANKVITFRSPITNSAFKGQVKQVHTNEGDQMAVSVEISGSAYYTAQSTFVAEANDETLPGFLLT